MSRKSGNFHILHELWRITSLYLCRSVVLFDARHRRPIKYEPGVKMKNDMNNLAQGFLLYTDNAQIYIRLCFFFSSDSYLPLQEGSRSRRKHTSSFFINHYYYYYYYVFLSHSLPSLSHSASVNITQGKSFFIQTSQVSNILVRTHAKYTLFFSLFFLQKYDKNNSVMLQNRIQSSSLVCK